MTQRKKLLLSVAPFAIVGVLGLYLLQLGSATKRSELKKLIDTPIKKMGIIEHRNSPYGENIKTSYISYHPSGFYNEANVARFAGGKQKPYDLLLIGHLRIVIPSKPRDWSNSGKSSEFLVSAPDSSRALLIKRNGTVYTPKIRSTGTNVFKVITTLDGCRITALEHDLILHTRNKTIELAGQQFDLFGQPTVLVMDTSYNIIDIHEQH